MTYKQIHVNLLLAFLLLILSAAMPATQEVKEPVLVVTGSDNGKEGSMWFKGNGTYVYRLCTFWDGPWGGMASTELFRRRGSIRGLAVGEQLQFYVASASGSVTGSDDNSAVTVPIGDGLCETVYNGGYTTRDKPPSSPSELPPSAFATAKLTRTGAGALLEIDGVPGAHCGEESLYFNSTSPTIRIIISNAELAAWDRLEKTVSGSGTGMDGHGTYAYTVTVTANLPNLGEVVLNGCSEMGIGEESVVTAKASKEGGTYRFWAEPREMFSIETNGSSATLRGSSPGRGTLYVEYTSADGKKTEVKKEAVCIQVEAYNSGQKIPQIAFFDINGNNLEGIIKVPVEIKPNDATDLLRFVPADPGLLTAVGLGDVVILQGIRLGKTTIQATTNCGATTGPAVEVEVVNCDDKTIARLEKMEKAAEENLKIAINELLNAIGSPKFQKARNEFLSSFNQMMLKIGLTIISNGKAPTKAINIAAEIADNGAALSEIISSSNSQELSNNVGKQAAGKSFENIVEKTYTKAVSDAYGKSLSAAIALDEVSNAAQTVCDNASEWALSSQMIEELKKKVEKANSEYDFVKSRQKLCARKKENTNNQEIPLADLKPIPQEQAPKQNPTPKTEQPPVQEPQNDQPTTEQPTQDDEILIDPEQPPIPSTKVGLPYEPSDCGCDSTKNITVTAKDFSTLGAGMKNLGGCVENFKSNSLTDYQSALQELSTLTGSMSNLLKTDAAAFLAKAKESKPQLDALVKRIKTYDEAGNAFLNKMGKCPESLTIGMEIFQSVEKITVDSIKAKY